MRSLIPLYDKIKPNNIHKSLQGFDTHSPKYMKRKSQNFNMTYARNNPKLAYNAKHITHFYNMCGIIHLSKITFHNIQHFYIITWFYMFFSLGELILSKTVSSGFLLNSCTHLSLFPSWLLLNFLKNGKTSRSPLKRKILQLILTLPQ